MARTGSLVKSLPDRPLSPVKMVNTSKSRAWFVMFPATPNSMFDGDEMTDVHDLLIATDTVLIAVAYDDLDGWILVARFDDNKQLDDAITAIIDYRKYPISDDQAAIIVEEYEKIFDDEFHFEP